MIPEFDWLTEYGPHWEPGTTAFWLEPKNARQVKSWFKKYRPNEKGYYVLESGERVRIDDRDVIDVRQATQANLLAVQAQAPTYGGLLAAQAQLNPYNQQRYGPRRHSFFNSLLHMPTGRVF